MTYSPLHFHREEIENRMAAINQEVRVKPQSAAVKSAAAAVSVEAAETVPSFPFSLCVFYYPRLFVCYFHSFCLSVSFRPSSFYLSFCDNACFLKTAY